MGAAVALILAAWWEASSYEKKQRFLEHLAWADSHSALDTVVMFLRCLGKQNWYTNE